MVVSNPKGRDLIRSNSTREVRSHEIHETLHCFMCNYAIEIGISCGIAQFRV